MKEEMLLGLCERRSIRKFKSEQITDAELRSVLRCGTYAPTALGRQTPIIVAVQNPDEVRAVSALNAKFTANSDPYYGAPTILIVLVPKDAYLGQLDGAAAMTNLCNAAYAAGLGSCWVNRAQFMFETNEGRDMLKRWGIEGSWQGVGSIALGYADTELPAPAPRKDNYCYIIK